MARRVVITGMGLVCPLGNSPEVLWEALVSGKSGVRHNQAPEAANLPTPLIAEAWDFAGGVDDFGPLDKSQKKAVRKALKVMCRETQMAVVTAHLAMADAAIGQEDAAPERSGAVYGSDYMLTEPDELTASALKCGAGTGEFDFSRWGTDGLAEMTPLWMLKYLPNMPASHIAIFHDLRGPSNSITHREASSNLAVGEAYHTIMRNSADRMVAGATGTRTHLMKAIHSAQTEQLAGDCSDPAEASRPFDANRSGQVLGEGAATVILEELECAKARGATIYAEVVGAASSTVTERNMVAQRDKALALAMRQTLRDAKSSPEDVGHIHAHGLSTVTCDIEEARAIGEVFGKRAEEIPVVSAKSNFGNLGAGSGMVELIASVMALGRRQLFPVLNYQTPDPECPLAVVTRGDTNPGSSFLNLNVTPQGQASAVMVRAYE